MAWTIIWEIRLPRGAGGADSWRGAGTVRVSVTDLFPQSDRGSLCAGNFFRCKTDDSPGDDILLGRGLVAGSVVLILASFIGAIAFYGFCDPDRQ